MRLNAEFEYEGPPTYVGTMLYSVETHRYREDKYIAYTSDYIQGRLGRDKDVQTLKPVAEGDTRGDAIYNLSKNIYHITGVKPVDQSFINVRHHDEYACYYCSYFPKFDTYEDWKKHYETVHEYLMGSILREVQNQT